MSIRSWQAAQSQQIELGGQVWPVVAQEDLVKAVLDGVIVLDRSGGCLQVVLQRQPTGMPNEYVTVAAMVVWQDRTNAKPQPEDRGLPMVEAEALEQNGSAAAPTDEQVAAVVGAYAEAGAVADELEVDESAVPEALRG